MKTFVEVRVGMRFYYDCPGMGDDFRSNAFFQKYQGRQGVIVGFPTERVGILDSKGRTPGVYIKPSGVNVKFDGEEEVHNSLNLGHFILIEPTSTVVLTKSLNDQRLGDLEHEVLFYPGDTVHKSDDLLRNPRVVDQVILMNDGTLNYRLAETPEDESARKVEDDAKRAKAREEDGIGGIISMMGVRSFARTEQVSGDDIVMVERGNLHHLYTDPTQMTFADAAEEVRFWSQEGLSATVYEKSRHIPRWDFTLELAQAMVEAGEADLIIEKEQFNNIVVVPDEGKFNVRKLHERFASHRERVREVSAGLSQPPPEVKVALEDRMLSMFS